MLRSALALAFAFPIVFMLISSFKPDQQIFADLGNIRVFLPVGHLSLGNHTAVLDRVPAAPPTRMSGDPPSHQG
ncbi:hypothetical protein [Streptomyces sp. CB01881]|uniref:hypothetical protein n=1 Tax=Streptomyces sp. CB01881 TaxID=2078691 RepID=UPI000CDCC9C3|nr:hypothetical protein [Streptomyces sp. CB01881]AUY53082.1 hypothetical protein C2142_33895 [Streptomyces sp. CB01881]TYC70798.1 hypothetical protein EH183_33960 [Streptomyces sp. CB01881]